MSQKAAEAGYLVDLVRNCVLFLYHVFLLFSDMLQNN